MKSKCVNGHNSWVQDGSRIKFDKFQLRCATCNVVKYVGRAVYESFRNVGQPEAKGEAKGDVS